MIRFAWHGPFAFATLDRPQARHALNDAMVQALLDACTQAMARADARALVIRGSGGQFCAGGDFAGFKSMIGAVPPAGAPDPIVGVNRTFGRLLETLAALEVPTVAVVEGAAMGGGVGLAAVCDIVIAAASARFATPEVTLGLPPAWYKSSGYRSRAVIEPRAVLREFGLTLPDEIEVRVWDSTAEIRYLVLPQRPPGTDGMSEADLAALVTRDSMIGVGVVRAPGERA